MSKKFYLKDWHGKEKEFTDEKIFVRGENGELIQFTQGEGAVVQPLEVTENGTYTAPDGVDGYSSVSVNVPTPEIKLQEKTITENGEYTADAGFDGLLKVLVEVAGEKAVQVKYGRGWDSQISNGVLPITHNLGVVPDLIAFVIQSDASSGISTDGNLAYIASNNFQIGSRYARMVYIENGKVCTKTITNNISFNASYSNTQYGLAPTETTFQIPKAIKGHDYCWIAIAGLT